MSAFLDAAIAKVKVGRTSARIYEANAVPATPQYPYSVVSVTRERPDNYTLDANHGTRDYRVTVQSFGKGTSASDQAHEYNDQADDNLLDQSLTVAGYSCNQIRWQLTAEVRDPDTNGVLGVTSTYLFTTTKES